MPDGFYEAVGDDLFRSAEVTAGPWSAEFQHGGPPAALMGRAFERCEPRPGMRVARMTAEILGPVPVAPLRAVARVVRPGRRVTLLAGELLHEERPVLRATGWRLARGPAEFAGIEAGAAPPPVPAADEARVSFGVWPSAYLDGYLSMIDWRFVDGSFGALGPARAWARPRIPLVAGEENSPLVRTLVLADAGSGVGNQFDLGKWLVINTDLTVALFRDPVGEWIFMDSRESGMPGGSGLAETMLADPAGPVGRGLQTLFVGER